MTAPYLDEAAIIRRTGGDKTVRLTYDEALELVRRWRTTGQTWEECRRVTGLRPERYMDRPIRPLVERAVDRARTGNQSPLPPIVDIAAALQNNETTIAELSTAYGVSQVRIRDRLRLAGYSSATGRPAETGGWRPRLESRSDGQCGVYVSATEGWKGLPLRRDGDTRPIVAEPGPPPFDWSQHQALEDGAA